MPESNEMMSVEGQLVGMSLAGPQSFSNQELNYLKGALDVDETLLFSGDINAANTTATLTESITNFSRIRIKYGLRFNNSPKFYDEFPTDKTLFFCSKQCYQDNGLLTCGGLLTISGTTATLSNWFQAVGTTITANDGKYYFVVHEIVGINRISGGN